MGKKEAFKKLEKLLGRLEEIESLIDEKNGKYVNPEVHSLIVERIKIKKDIKKIMDKKDKSPEKNYIDICLGVGPNQIFPEYQRIFLVEEETKKRKNPNKSKDKRLGLINYEGDCIYAKKTPEGNILIYDQYNSLIDVADFLEMSNWIEGVIPFKDSKGKEWFYPDAHKEAKPTIEDIFNFIKK